MITPMPKDVTFAQITQILEQVVQHQAILSTRMTELANRMDALTVRVDKLADTVERYIRFRGNGQEPN